MFYDTQNNLERKLKKMIKRKETAEEAIRRRIEQMAQVGDDAKTVRVGIGGHGYKFDIVIPGLLNGSRTVTKMTFYENSELNRAMSNIHKKLAEYSIDGKIVDGFYVVYEKDLPQIKALIAKESEPAVKYSDDCRQNYSAYLNNFLDLVADEIVKNKKKYKTKEIQSKLLKMVPTANALRSSIDIAVEPDPLCLCHDYLAETKMLIDETNDKRLKERLCNSIAKSCNPIIIKLATFANQMKESGHIHGGTAKSYTGLVELLDVTNSNSLKFPELAEFVKIAHYAVDNPCIAVQALIIGFIHFYGSQGMLDYLPYEELGLDYSREQAEAYGNSEENSFSAWAKDLPTQIAMFN